MGSSKKKRKKLFAPNQPAPPKRGPDAYAASQVAGTLEAKPWPAPGEPAHDIALFNDVSLPTLSGPLQSECQIVRDALEQISQGRFSEASEALTAIARSSPYADWRLLARGLTAFYSQDYAAARDAWSRLDPSRRPSRIAKSLLAAVKQEQPVTLSTVQCDASGTTLARNILTRQSITAQAQRLTGTLSLREGVEVSLRQVGLLRSFADQFRKYDPEFVNHLLQAFLRLSTFQGDPKVYETLRGMVPGPKIDPQWHLLTAQYLFAARVPPTALDKALSNFVNDETSALASPVKQAIQSCLLVQRARSADELQQLAQPSWLGNIINTKPIEGLLEQAIKVYPRNRQAYDELLSLCEKVGEKYAGTSHAQRVAELELTTLKSLVENFPDDVQPILRLVNHYMAADQLAEAAKIVKHLENKRLDDPQARALPWRLEVRSLMHASRLKKCLSGLDIHLDAALEKWPNWLPKTWLPYLRAAVQLRIGNAEKFKSLIQQAQQTQPLPATVADVMIFAALQHFNLPPKELKRFRALVDEASTKPQKLSDEDLIGVAEFLFDLSRAGLRHKAYRLHAGRFAKELVRRIQSGQLVADTRLEKTICWLLGDTHAINRHFFVTMIAYARRSHRTVAALMLAMGSGGNFRFDRLPDFLLEVHEQGLQTEQDPFYRYQLQSSKTYYQQHLDSMDSMFNFQSMFGRFMGRSGTMEDEDDEDDDEDEDGPWGSRADDYEEDADFEFGEPVDEPVNEIDDAGRDSGQRFDSPHSSPRSAAEKKAFDKQRQKQLARAKKRK